MISIPKHKKDKIQGKENKEHNETQNNKKEIEVIEASFDNEQLFERAKKLKILPEKFWQAEEIWRILLDPTLIDKQNISKFDLAELLKEFTEKMLESDIIDFRISGMAIYNTAKLHHRKIKEVIDEEEKVQVKELKERAKREIPKAMPQPLREPKQIATKDELFDAMRAAIIETMQKREILRIRREKREQRKQELKFIRAKGQLPKELLRLITGKEKTITEIHEDWYQKIKAKIKLNDNKFTTFNELREDIIEHEYPNDSIAQKLKSIELFIALMFLSTGGSGKSSPKLELKQMEDFGDIEIRLAPLI
ncbi:MAG: hypothetical protein ACTSO9_00095 [Candidatus Helarchaeota archaeon]